MSLIQPLNFRTLKTGCFKMPRLQTAVFQTGITVASGLYQFQMPLEDDISDFVIVWSYLIGKSGERKKRLPLVSF